MLKMNQQLNKNIWALGHQKRKSLGIENAERKAENRTKIQLGGLILKAGLASHLKIEPGDDLQLDPIAREKATTLLGVLMYITEHLKNDHDDTLKQECSHLGMKAMVQQFLRSKNHERSFQSNAFLRKER